MKTGIERIAAERQRQIDVEGWTPEHDAGHNDGSLAKAAISYVIAHLEINGLKSLATRSKHCREFMQEGRVSCKNDCNTMYGKTWSDIRTDKRHETSNEDRAITAWNTRPLKEGRITDSEKALWALLDDIDTATDRFKPDRTPFMEYVYKTVPKRFKYLTSDGYKLSLPSPPLSKEETTEE